MFAASSIDIYICLLCILNFVSNIVGPAGSREGRAREAHTSSGGSVAEAGRGASATDVGGPPEEVGSDTGVPQPAVCKRASVDAEPWSRGGATGATPSASAGVLASSTPSTGCYFSGELLSNLALFCFI